MSAARPYLPAGLPRPEPEASGLDAPYWKATGEHLLMVQHCPSCSGYQWGPEWVCWRCGSSDVGWEEVEGIGTIYSWERPWHPAHPALAASMPYLIVLVELPHADGVRMVSNLLGDPRQEVRIGSPVHASFEDHDGYSLVQWALD
jgi:uncharacterized OB-fold protein